MADKQNPQNDPASLEQASQRLDAFLEQREKIRDGGDTVVAANGKELLLSDLKRLASEIRQLVQSMDSSHTLRIYPDQDTASPREDDNLGTLACWHRRYTLGDTQPKEDPIEYQESLPKDSLIVPIYMIDHSGIALSTKDYGDPWDSGQVGIYHLSPEEIIREYGEDTPETRATALEVIKAEIEEYSDYVNGNCWGFEILDADGDHIEGCGGFIGSDPIENGMADHLGDETLPLLFKAAEQAGMSVSEADIEKHMALRVEARSRRSMAP